MIDQKTIDRAIRLLLDAAPAGSEVILFGSYARGDAGEDSDLDFLIIEPVLESRRDEMVRLRTVLRPMRIPVDVLVVSRDAFQDWKEWPNNIISEAVREGRSFRHAA
jgi:predicted nucleotidyltransferase